MKNYRASEKKTPTGRTMICGSEDDEQQMIVEWAGYMSSKYPELQLLYHVPNGGSRNRLEAVKFKRMGVKAGVPDLVLPVPRGGYAGAYIELKVGKNKPSENQKEWLEKLEAQGYFVTVCYGSLEAEKCLEEYLEREKTLLLTETMIRRMLAEAMDTEKRD